MHIVYTYYNHTLKIFPLLNNTKNWFILSVELKLEVKLTRCKDFYIFSSGTSQIIFFFFRRGGFCFDLCNDLN